MIDADPSVRVGPIFSLSPFDSSRRVQYARHRNGQSRLVLDLPPAALPLNSDVRDVRDVFLPGIQDACGTASRTNADSRGHLPRPLSTTDSNSAAPLLPPA